MDLAITNRFTDLPVVDVIAKSNVIDTVPPSDGKFISLIIPYMNTIAFQIFLDELNKHIGDKKIVIIMDNAAWHKPYTTLRSVK